VSDVSATVAIRPFTMADYDVVLAIWERSEGIGLSGADSGASIQSFLERNPSSCFVAVVAGEAVGAVLGGHDGRRGYIYHLAVDMDFRRRGIGTALLDTCLAALRGAGIQKCHLFVYQDNVAGIEYWRRRGWEFRTDIAVMSIELGG
jgi:putative acetyltransferase